MLVVNLEGSHYEMGLQQGQKLFIHRPALIDLINTNQERIKKFPRQVVLDVMNEIIDVISIHSAPTLDMMNGIADGFEVSRESILYLMMNSYIEDKEAIIPKGQLSDGGCTTWAISKEKTDQDKVILAKNRDYMVSHRTMQVIFRCRPAKGNEYFSINSTGACNVFSSGINSEGLSIADTRVTSFDVGPGLPRFSLMMHILENFKYTNEVIDYLKSVKRMGGGNLIFADEKGEIGTAEIGYKFINISYQKNGFLVSTNHFEGIEMQRNYRITSEEGERDSEWRFDRVFEELTRTGGKIDLRIAINLMSCHGEKFAICNHETLSKLDDTATVSSAIFFPQRRGFYYCDGFPCTTPFTWISFC